MKEGEGREQTWVCFKALRLIPPELAQDLGIPAEGPVFVSPYTRSAYCPTCGINYGPLVYQAGFMVEAHHVHNRSGGIYFTRTSNPENNYISRTSASLGGWIALVEPLREIGDDDGRLMPRRVMVIRIVASCFAPMANRYCSKDLEAGFVIQRDGLLHPVCDLDEHQRLGQLVFKFRIREGHVVFRNI